MDDDTTTNLPLSFESQETLERFSQRRRLSVPKSDTFRRKDVVNAFQESFELIGGVSRLALWGHENPGSFYRLYSKLLPTQNQNQIDHSGNINVLLSIPRSPLDGECEVISEADEEPEDAP